MPALITTPGGATSNAYVDLATADTVLLTERLHATAWSTATQTQKESAIIWSTRLLDEFIDWEGAKASELQALRVPRHGLQDADGFAYDSDVIPREVQVATAEFAFALLARDRISEPALFGLGMSEMELGPMSAVVDKGMILALIPDHVLAMLSPLGTLVPEATRGTMQVVKLVRG